MKFTKIVSIFALSTMLFTSCDDQVMDWYKDPSHGEITNADLPLKLAEKISRYDVLKSYTSFTLGAGIDDAMYLKDATYRKLTSENFDEVTLGYSMKHGAMVNAKGEINFTNVDAFMAKAKEDGLTVFGHTLVWHSNQNASYLNGLLAPTIIPGSSGTNVLNLAPLKDKTFTGWANWNKGAGITIEDAAGLGSGTPAIKLISSSTSAAYYSLQLGTPEIPIVSGHKYEISFYIKSDKAGQGRLSFADLTNNYPHKDWYATGGDWTESFATTSQWQQVKITVNDFSKATFKMNIDLGKLPDVTYFIDLNSLSVVDKDATPTVVNLLTNGDFEKGDITPWGGWGNSSTRSVSAAGEGYPSKGYAMVLVNPTAANSYSAQQVYTLSNALESGKAYTCTFMVKASVTAKIQFEIQGADYNADYSGGISVGTTWTQVTKTITPTKADRTKFIFDFGEIAATYYIDDLVLTSGETTGGPTPPIVVEKTPAEKTALIGAAMEDWITKMMAHYKADVHAWDVVNEPIKDGNTGEVRDGNVTDPSSDTFYWVKYLGKDYAVTAFKLAREKGNGSSDKLFINDYNLESNLEKCQGLIDYVAYIESKGAFVDGIGTQMHISTSANKDKMVQMFQKLAATGKLIKISELDITVGTKTPTVDQQAAQAEMYQFVLDSYMKYIPAPQRYGVTAWGISDSATEHEYWLKDDAPNLWDGTYARKHAYKGFCDGLAGRDVSLEFSGEIQ